MTLEELWELFPIFLTEHKECWDDWYHEEEKQIRDVLPITEYRISHIGSTSIKGIWAKPIVDIMLEISKNVSMETIKEVMPYLIAH